MQGYITAGDEDARKARQNWMINFLEKEGTKEGSSRFAENFFSFSSFCNLQSPPGPEFEVEGTASSLLVSEKIKFYPNKSVYMKSGIQLVFFLNNRSPEFF